MKIALFGSTGPTGKEVIKQALEAGYGVTAFARNPEKLQEFKHEKLKIIKGELSDREAIEDAIRGADGVISVLGPSGNVKNTALSDGVQNIVDAMKKLGVNRIIALATPSVKDVNDRFDFKFRFLVALVKTGVRGAYDEIVRIGDIVRSSGLKWTLVRVGLLNDKSVQPVKVGYYGHGLLSVPISRASIAKFMLDQVTTTDYIRKAPGISN
ncbi:NAD(P)-dependent oxidoreductase [Laceyella putida]|uniref:NAD(P)-dependent oxidoreductase n=1 Tax=Laceyella putida TaxID=110101 RepID=A0ABW2RMN6_9BACL